MTSISNVSDNLAKIIDMAQRLEARALDRANDRLMPGGEALVNLAGSSNRYEWQRRIDVAERPDEDGVSHVVNVDHEDPDELWPPITILRWWSDDYRQQLGMERDPGWRPTLVTESTFLRNRDVAEWIWQHEVRWDDYAADVARARAKLENILIEGNRSERSRVVCGSPDCEDPRTLIRVYAKRRPVAWGCGECGQAQAHPAPCEGCHAESLVEEGWSSDVADDLWKCGSCKRKYNHDDVEKFYAQQLRTAPAERWVATSHAVQLMRDQGWQERVVRAWFGDDTAAGVEVKCEETSGRRMVLWSTLWRRHLLEKHQREQRAKRRDDRSA